MSLLAFPAYDAETEADVEQKFIYPLLSHPSYLDIPPKSILAKKSLGAMRFTDKAALPKNYVPDFVLFFLGLPICVVEAKQPEISIETAIKEARLYGQILNQNFPSGINPVRIVVGCNGRELAVGPVDSTEFKKFSTTDIVVGAQAMLDLRALIGVRKLSEHAARTKASLAVSNYISPRHLLDSQMFIDRVKQNSLAPYLQPLNEMFFRAEDPEKIQLILDKAYVDTRELREYDTVLNSLLKQVERRFDHSQPIQTDRKKEYTLTPELSRYQNDLSGGGRLHLIIGARGSGKSLFIARFFSHLLPESLAVRSAWCVVDFNKAPADIGSVEDYICDRFIENVINLKFDPFGIDGITRVFSTELSRLQRGPLSLIKDEAERERLISNELFKLSNDKRLFAIRLAKYVTTDLSRPLIVAFDNVDRRESTQQLQIFQAAQWFRKETNAFALLTLRDVTFERFKNEPPLDTFAHLNNFYIRPPRFSLVLQKRLQLALDEGLSDITEIEQPTSGGSRFKYDKEQLGKFLKTIYEALFVGQQQIGRIVDALAERDVREALGMFARILSSGHFDADQVIGIGVGASSQIDHDTLLKILMRTDYRLYSEDAGFIKNIFWVPSENFTGNIFLVCEVLGFFGQHGASGTDKVTGFWRIEELVADLAGMGFEEDEVRSSVQKLIKWKLLVYDGGENEKPDDKDLIKITPSGYIHVKSLPHFIEYLSSVAIYSAISDNSTSRRIADIWDYAISRPDIDFPHKHEVASLFANYLVREKARLDAQNPFFLARSRESERIVTAITHVVNTKASVADAQRREIARKAAERRGRRPHSR